MAYIHSIQYYLPTKVLTNDELLNKWGCDANLDKLLAKVGIEERYIADEDEFISDLAIKASQKLFDEHSISPDEIDFILLCTQSPDYILPTTACIIQDRLNIPTKCGALDFNLGCSGFVYGLALAKSLIDSQIANNVLLITSETYTKHINPLDKSTRPIFGDGAAAILIKGDKEDQGIGQFVLGTDGKGMQNLIIPAGGMKLKKSNETAEPAKDKYGNERSLNNLYMNGPEIFKFAVNIIPRLLEDTLAKNDLAFEDIDCFIFHQASKYLLGVLKKELKIDEDKFYINISSVGNTVSASIPIALKQAEEEKRIKKGDNIMLVGFGVGYSWGATVIKW